MRKLHFCSLGLLVCFVVIVLFTISSSCYAYSYDQFIEFLEINIDNYTDSDLKGAAQFILDYKDTFRNRFSSLGLDITDYSTWIVYGGGRTSFDNQLIFSNDLIWSCGQNNCINVYNGSSTIKAITFRRYMASVSSSLTTNLNWGLVTQRSSGLITGTNTTGVFYDSTITNQYYNTFGIVSDLESVTYNSYNGYALKLNYMNTYSLIGNIEGVSDNTHFINVTFGITGNENPNISPLFNQKNLYNGLNTSQDIYIDDNYNIYVKNRLLYLNTLYTCYVVCYTDSTESVITAEDDEFFLTLNLNAVISGDNVASFGSGDSYNTQSSTNDIIGSLTEFTPLSSGDIVSNVDLVPMYEFTSGDSISNFFVDILRNISEVFLLDDEVTLHLTLPIFQHEISIRSDFWKTRDYLPQLADFIGGAWWLLICIGMVYKIDVLVELYNFGDFINASYQLYQTRRLL